MKTAILTCAQQLLVLPDNKKVYLRVKTFLSVEWPLPMIITTAWKDVATFPGCFLFSQS